MNNSQGSKQMPKHLGKHGQLPPLNKPTSQGTNENKD